MAVVIKVGETEAVSVGIGEKVYIQGDTGNGIEYITLNADYTLTVHYTNGTEWTSTSIRGEKGDKGDTGDTGATGPQGPKGDKGDPGEVTQAEFDELADEVADQKSAIEALDSLVDRKAGALVDTASGAIASFVPDATIDNLLGVTVDVEPVQAGSGDPSPDNVRPISGWSEVEIERTCVNVWDGEWEIGGIDDNTGEKITVSTQKRSKNYISVVPGSTYYMNTPGVGNAGAFAYAYDSSFGFIGRIRIGSAVHLENLAFTTPANCRYILFKIGSSSYDTAQISINYPSTDHAYHVYTGNTYTISLGQTVYGGTLDATAGTITVDRVYTLWTGATPETYVRDSGAYGYRFRHAYADADQTAGRKPVLCNMGVFSGSDSVGTAFLNVGNIYYYPPSTITTVDEFKTWLATNNLQFVYPLATPITITLDPVTISTISGQTNNLWSDAGDVDVTYAADIKAYIDRLNQPTEDDMIANSLIAANKYFTVNNRLFLSTASIAAGAQIIPGTNCTETSLAAALNALNA